ncbi:hypothetical protein HMPREF2768_00170 [Propionibacterium sp. HMSC068C01]|nr:hypothetical protein HMPREF2768_00170 [Propionibacterium sp. HMSC068C01]
MTAERDGRDVVVGRVSMSGDERARIDRAVETAGLSRSEWIRRRCAEATTDTVRVGGADPSAHKWSLSSDFERPAQGPANRVRASLEIATRNRLDSKPASTP